MDGIIYYSLHVSAEKFAGGVFELSLNEYSTVSRNKLMFALIGGSHINNYENNIHPPTFTTDPLLLERNCGCHLNILYAKILCSGNDNNPAEFSSVNLKVAWESDCDPNEPMQLIIYVLNNEIDVQPFINYMRQSKSENIFAYNQDANGQQSIQNLEQGFVLNTITLSLQDFDDSTYHIKNDNYHEIVFSISQKISRRNPLVVDVQTISNIIFNHQFNTYVPMSSFYNSANNGNDFEHENYNSDINSIVDITCTENCSIRIKNVHHICSPPYNSTEIHFYYETNCNKIDSIYVYHVEPSELAATIESKLTKMTPIAFVAYQSNSTRSSNFLPYLVYSNTTLNVCTASTNNSIISNGILKVQLPEMNILDVSTFVFGLSASMIVPKWHNDFSNEITFPTTENALVVDSISPNAIETCSSPCSIAITHISILQCNTSNNEFVIQASFRSNCSLLDIIHVIQDNSTGTSRNQNERMDIFLELLQRKKYTKLRQTNNTAIDLTFNKLLHSRVSNFSQEEEDTVVNVTVRRNNNNIQNNLYYLIQFLYFVG
jgi:hypothetical protein